VPRAEIAALLREVWIGEPANPWRRREETGTTVPRLVTYDAISQSIGDRLPNSGHPTDLKPRKPSRMHAANLARWVVAVPLAAATYVLGFAAMAA
jgi:hypothetical protein